MASPSGSHVTLRSFRAIPRGVWALGFVSLFMDTSSELIHALLPVYLVTGLGASMMAVGFIEGAAEAIASITKLFSGVVSDWVQRRKLLTVLGYGLAALTKPVFPLAPSVEWIAAARWIDRVGKGIRGAPRDALVADIAPPELRGASFGLRQSLDTIGAFLGPLAAILLMWRTGNDFRFVFWFAVIPAALAVLVLVIGVKEPEHRSSTVRRFPLRRSELRRLPGLYWLVILVAAVFTLARFSEAFLILRAQQTGLAISLVPVVLVIMNIVYAATAYPVGALSDKTGRFGALFIGLVLLMFADLVLAVAPEGFYGVLLGVAIWGLHMGFTQGVLSTLIADASPPELRGTAFGVFNLVTGFMLLAASALAGMLWSWAGAASTFIAGAAFAALTLLGLVVLRGRLKAATAA